MKRLLLATAVVLLAAVASTACEPLAPPPPPPPVRPPPPPPVLPPEIPPYQGSGPTVGVLGDSITYYTKDRTQTALNAAGYSASITGNSGLTLPDNKPWGWLYWLNTPRVLVINLGTNDVARQSQGNPDYTVDSFKQHMQEYIAAFPQSCIVVTTIARWQWGGLYTPDYNAYLRTLPHVADWDAIIAEHPEYLPDGIHPFDDDPNGHLGNIAYADMITSAVQGCSVGNGAFAANDLYTTAFDTPMTTPAPGVLANDAGPGVTVTGHTQPAHGVLTQDPDGGFTYQPEPGYAGGDQYSYTITDADGATSTGTVVLRVNPVPPVPGNDTFSTPYETPLDVAAPGVLTNDTGSYVRVTGNSAPTYGTVYVNVNGSLTYSPPAGFSGDDTFTYTVADVAGQSATASVTVTVAPPVPATATDDSYATPSETLLTVPAPGLLANDAGSGMYVTAHTDPGHGSLALQPDGSFTYQSEPAFVGTDSFTYTITTSVGDSATATATIEVQAPPPPPPPSPPAATNDAYTTPFETTLTVPAPGVLGNDTGSSVTVTTHTDPAHGTLTLDADGGFTYQPEPGYSGSDTFTYEVTDSAAQTASATVTLTVDPT